MYAHANEFYNYYGSWNWDLWNTNDNTFASNYVYQANINVVYSGSSVAGSGVIINIFEKIPGPNIQCLVDYIYCTTNEGNIITKLSNGCWRYGLPTLW